MKSTSNNHFSNAPDGVLVRKRGFTLLETLLAIGILSVVVAQVVSVQGAQISVSRIAADNIRATWALRHMTSQLQYVIDTLGIEGLPKNPVELPWTGDANFTVRLEVKELKIEPSKMILAAMKLAMTGGGASEDEKEEEGETMSGFKEMASLIDSKLPKDLYRSYNITVSWKEGDKTRSIVGGGMIIDNKVLTGLVSAGAAAGAGANTGSSSGGNNSGSGNNSNNGNKPNTGGGTGGTTQ